MSLSDIGLRNKKLPEELLLILPNSVPPSLNLISAPPASKTISETASNIISSGAAIVIIPAPLSVNVTALLPSPDIDKAPVKVTPVPEVFKVATPL